MTNRTATSFQATKTESWTLVSTWSQRRGGFNWEFRYVHSTPDALDLLSCFELMHWHGQSFLKQRTSNAFRTLTKSKCSSKSNWQLALFAHWQTTGSSELYYESRIELRWTHSLHGYIRRMLLDSWAGRLDLTVLTLTLSRWEQLSCSFSKRLGQIDFAKRNFLIGFNTTLVGKQANKGAWQSNPWPSCCI